MDKDKKRNIGIAVSALALSVLSCNAAQSILFPPNVNASTTPLTESSPVPDNTPTVTIHTATPSPTHSPTPTAFPTGTPDSRSQAWPGQAELNDMGEDRISNLDMEQYLDFAVDEMADQEASGTTPDRDDSALTFLGNEFTSPSEDSVPNPLDETGHELDSSELNKLVQNGNVLDILDNNPRIGSLIQRDEQNPNLVHVGVYADADNADAAKSILAGALNAVLTGNQADLNRTVQNTVTNPESELLSKVARLKDEMNSRVLSKFLAMTEGEITRRNSGDPSEASARIDPVLRESPNVLMCEEMQGPSVDGTRNGQGTQVLVPVKHIENGKETLNEADVNNETFFFVLTVDTTTDEWDIGGLTSRGFDSNTDSVSVNEMVSCEIGGGRVPTATPRSPSRPGNTPQVNPSSTPQEDSTVTEAPTQPPQPTRTPGGSGATPVVPTPMNTPVPTQEVEPTIPPPAEPSSTPAF